jgi:hypothetical protein
MWKRVSRFISVICIFIYVGAAVLAGLKIYSGVREQRRTAQEEFIELTMYAGIQGGNFLSESFKNDIRDSVIYSKALTGVIISSPAGQSFSAEKAKSNAIRMFGETPRFDESFFLYAKPLFSPLNIEGQRNVTISAIFPYIETVKLLEILRNSLLAVLIATILAFCILILDLTAFGGKTRPVLTDSDDDETLDTGLSDTPLSSDLDEDLLGNDNDNIDNSADNDTENKDTAPADFNLDFPQADTDTTQNTEISDDTDFNLDLGDIGDIDTQTGGTDESAGEPELEPSGGLDDFGEPDIDAIPDGDDAASLVDAPPLDDFGLSDIDLSDTPVDEEIDAGDTGKATPEENALQEKLEETLREAILMEKETTLVSLVYEPPGGASSLLTAMSSINDVYESIFTMAAKFWRRENMVFRSRKDGLFAIVPELPLDEVFTSAKEFQKQATDEIVSASNGKLYIGLSAAQKRKDIDAGRLLIEALGAVKRAKADENEPVAEFKVDLEKWENFARDKEEAGM